MKKSLIEILTRQFPEACASIRGSRKFSDIRGCVYFYEVEDGVLVRAQVLGLPYTKEECKNEIFALSCFYTENFEIDDIIGKTIIIHQNPDDFTTQPSGNAGTKIACGEIRKVSERISYK